MPEEVIAAQTSEATATQDGVAGAVQNTEEKTTDASFTDGGNEGVEEGAKEPAKADKPAQTKEQNSEFARKRREAERQKELKDVRDKTIIETLGGKNPYTDEPMTDSLDVEEYLTMKEIEKNGGDPVADFAKHQKENARRTSEQEKTEAETREWYRKDGEAFAKKYPDVSLEMLESDAMFRDYAEGKVGKRPLTEIWEGYQKLVGNKGADGKEKNALQMAAQVIANRKAAVGSVANANGGNSTILTREEVSKMSVQECEKKYDIIIKSMPHWK